MIRRYTATVRFGSVAVIEVDFSRTAAFTQSGRSDAWESAQSKVRFRPKPVIRFLLGLRLFVHKDPVQNRRHDQQNQSDFHYVY